MSTQVHPDWKLHQYYFDGQCIPGKNAGPHSTFSVGIFRIEQGKQGYKRGPVKIRIRGYNPQAKEVYSLAQKICNRLNDPESGYSIECWSRNLSV